MDATVYYAIFCFVVWTAVLHFMHVTAHRSSFLWQFHQDHHRQVTDGTIEGFSWKNIFLFFDNWKSTADQWLIEVIPTIIFSILTQQFWIIIFYYVWAAFIQETVEHNPRFDLFPFITSGRYHLIHHKDPTRNFAVFFWYWDWLTGTMELDY